MPSEVTVLGVFQDLVDGGRTRPKEHQHPDTGPAAVRRSARTYAKDLAHLTDEQLIEAAAGYKRSGLPYWPTSGELGRYAPAAPVAVGERVPLWFVRHPEGGKLHRAGQWIEAATVGEAIAVWLEVDGVWHEERPVAVEVGVGAGELELVQLGG